MKKLLLSLTVLGVVSIHSATATQAPVMSPQETRNLKGDVLHELQKWFSVHDYENGIRLLRDPGNVSKNDQQRHTIEQPRQTFTELTCFERNTLKVVYTEDPNEIGKNLFELNLLKRWQGNPTDTFLKAIDGRNDRAEVTIHYKDASGKEQPGLDVVAANQNYLLRGEDYRAHANQDKTRHQIICMVPVKYHTATP